jgi:TetR/AcrR family transcriptional regulator, cholesterol catabolism regulator
MADRATDPAGELPTQLARSQRARRERILAAVLELAAEGGYDAVQVREVAACARVALRTIYNYYDSRENLLYAAMMEWRRRVASESVANVSGTTLEERLLSLLRHNFEVFAEAPKLFEAFSRLDLRPGDVDPVTYKTMVLATDELLADLDPAYAEDLKLILGRFIYGTMSLAAQGHLPIEDVWPDIERMVRRVAAER